MILRHDSQILHQQRILAHSSFSRYKIRSDTTNAIIRYLIMLLLMLNNAIIRDKYTPTILSDGKHAFVKLYSVS